MKWMVLVGLLLAGSAMAQQTYYRCEVDGVVIFSDQPCNQESIKWHAAQQSERVAQPMTRRQSARPTRLDIGAYCEKLRQVSGSYQIRATCLESEREARAVVMRMRAPEEIVTYCNRIGETSGSYQIMQTCIESELKAMRR